MNVAPSFRWFSVPLFLLLLLMPGPAGAIHPAVAAAARPLAAQSYQASSWAMGIVVPQGASLEGGGKVVWENVRNVTAFFRLPNITRPDLPVYCVLSVMTDDGSVLQAAAGVYKNSPTWLVYADMVTEVKSVPPEYQHLLNASGPPMSPNDLVSISIFRSPPGLWNLRVVSFGTGSSVDHSFPPGGATSLKAGDQELFAIEAYSRSERTFQNMGNLTLKAILVDGKRVTDGFYSYGNWDPARNPLFVVGSAGTSPPYFIYLRSGGNGSFLWTFENEWTSDEESPGPGEGFVLPLLLASSLVAVAFAVARSLHLRASQRPSG